MSFNKKFSIENHTRVFVETGTFHGAGVRKALEAGYKKVYSIEIFEPLYLENIERFRDYISEGRVTLLFGDSSHLIGDLVSGIDEPITFWFDAHDQTMNDAGVGELKCPIVSEINSVIKSRNSCKRLLDVLLIDDLRLIEKKEVGWGVNLDQLYSSIWNYNKDFCLTRELGIIDHDILRCAYKHLMP